MPESWFYFIGGILIAMLIFTIGFNLLMITIGQSQKETALSSFEKIKTVSESVCSKEIGNFEEIIIVIPQNIRVIYATDDTKNIPSTITEKIRNIETSEGKNICMQFKKEENLRCELVGCSIKMPCLGALETYDDFQLMVNKILGRPLVKEYTLFLKKEQTKVVISLESCRQEGENCESSEQCCSWARYCWGEPEFTCHENCADIGTKARDSVDCCSGYLNYKTGLCEKLPITTTTIHIPSIPGKSKLGIQTQFQKPGVMSFIETVKPTVVKLMSEYKSEYKTASEIKQISPDTFIVGRIWDDLNRDDDFSHYKSRNPEQRAEEWFNRHKSIIESTTYIDCWEGYNEPVIFDSDLMNWFSRFEIKRMRLLEDMVPSRKACIGNFPVGNPVDLNLWSDFMDALEYASQNGHYLALHEYSCPKNQKDEPYEHPRMEYDFVGGIEDGTGECTGRYRRVYRQYIQPNNLDIPLVITETGIDSGGCEDCGWRSHTNAEDYLNQLIWYDSILKQDDYVIGATIFHYGQYGWRSFEIYPELTGDDGKSGPLVNYMT